MTNRKRMPWKDELKNLILDRDGRECYYCGSKENLALDHVYPFSLGGDDTAGNLITSCKACNSKKKGKPLLKRFHDTTKGVTENRNASAGIDNSLVVSLTREEYDLMFFENGVKRYEHRTREDKVANCGRVIERRTGFAREFRCKLPECEKCMKIRKDNRTNEFRERVLSSVANGDDLFYLKTSTDGDQKRFREAAWRYGLKYLCLPTAGGDKHVIVNGQIQDANRISEGDVLKLINECAGVMYSDRSKRVSGNLGLKK